MSQKATAVIYLPFPRLVMSVVRVGCSVGQFRAQMGIMNDGIKMFHRENSHSVWNDIGLKGALGVAVAVVDKDISPQQNIMLLFIGKYKLYIHAIVVPEPLVQFSSRAKMHWCNLASCRPSESFCMFRVLYFTRLTWSWQLECDFKQQGKKT